MIGTIFTAGRALLAAILVWAIGHANLPKTHECTQIGLPEAHIEGGNLYLTAHELCYKTCTYTDERNGRKEQVTKQVPYTVAHVKLIGLWDKELVAFDRHGVRIDSAILPMLLKEPQPVLLVPGLHFDAETFQTLKDVHLILIVRDRPRKAFSEP